MRDSETPEEEYELAVPRPESLIESLRSVGYSLPTAVADIIDNSIAAGAQNIWLEFHWAGQESVIEILDDGTGMPAAVLFNAMRPGSQSPLAERSETDLGRFGLGLKTASFSQARRLTVLSKTAAENPPSWQWDLDYVRKHKEWRLRKNGICASKLEPRFRKLSSGTLVVWELLDRVVDARTVSNQAAQEDFHKRIADVRQHLAMTFHRFLDGKAHDGRRALKIYINGTTAAHQVKAWDPFLTSSSLRTPVEIISYGHQQVRVQGFVLPHKDRLTPSEFEAAAGPKGWNAQQGFYVYRQDRVLVAGDWLRLGRGRLMLKEEHHRLARLSLEITNSQDFDWSLDVKKSTARPPALIAERLTDLAEAVRAQARQIFFHRSEVGPQQGAPATYPHQRPWLSVVRQGRAVYKVNREHPLPAGVFRKIGPFKSDVEALLRLIEETVPIDRIWLDSSESPASHAIPYQDTDKKILWSDIRLVFEMLKASGYSSELAAQYVCGLEPFNRYPDLTAKLREL